MAGSLLSIEIEYNNDDIHNMLQRLLNVTDDLEPAFRDIGESLLLSHDNRFRDQVDPEGNAWEPLSDEYKAQKKKNKNKILILDGHLSDELRYKADSDKLLFGTNKIYAATHQFGRPEANIPQREFLGVSEDDNEDILDIVLQHYELAIQG